MTDNIRSLWKIQQIDKRRRKIRLPWDLYHLPVAGSHFGAHCSRSRQLQIFLRQSGIIFLLCPCGDLLFSLNALGIVPHVLTYPRVKFAKS